MKSSICQFLHPVSAPSPCFSSFTLYLTGNPLVCGPDLCWARDHRIETAVSVTVGEQSCVEPEVHLTKTWGQLNIVNLGCSGQSAATNAHARVTREDPGVCACSAKKARVAFLVVRTHC